MRHGGGELSHAAEPREPRERFLMQAQYCLSAAALCHLPSSKKARQRENQHECLDFRHFGDLVRESVKTQNKTELSGEDAEADAFNSRSHGHPHDGHKEDVNELEVLRGPISIH